jgi:hypothetical protein
VTPTPTPTPVVTPTPTPTPVVTPTPTLNATDLYITSDQNFTAGQSYPARAALAQFSGPIAGAAVTFYINGSAFSAVTDAGGIAIYNFSTKSTDTVLNIYATYDGNATLLASTSATRSISLRQQTITFSPPASITYAPSIILSASASSGLTVDFSSATPAVCTVSVRTLTLISVGECVVKASQTGNNQFLPAANIDRSIAISKAPQTITFRNPISATSTVDNTVWMSNVTSSSGLDIEYQSLTGSICNILTLNGLTYVKTYFEGTCRIVVRQSGNAMYEPANSIEKSISVSKWPGSVLFETQPTVLFRTHITTSKIRVTVLGGGDADLISNTLSVCSVTPVVNNSATLNLVSLGKCSLTASHPGNYKYTAASPKTLSFDIRTYQSITFDPKREFTFFDPPYLLEASSSSGLPVTFSSSPSNVCSVSGNLLTFLPATKMSGECNVTASVGGYPLYVNETKKVDLYVNLISQTITVTGAIPEKIGYSGSGNSYNILFATASSGLTPVWGSETPNVCTVNGSELTPLGFGTCIVRVGQSGDNFYRVADSRSYSIKVTN